MRLIIDRAGGAGQNASAGQYRRMAWLSLFGLFHYFFIWWGDILFLYAAIGCIAFRFRAWEARRLIKWALGIFTFGVILTSLFFGAQLMVGNAADNPASSMAEAGREVRAEYARIDGEVTGELSSEERRLGKECVCTCRSRWLR